MGIVALRLSFGLIGISVLTTINVLAQSDRTSEGNRQSQSYQELVQEVRLLRLEVQRLGATTYRSQIIVERLKLQKEQVARLSHDLTLMREKILEARTVQEKLKSKIEGLEKDIEAGLTSPKILKELNAEIESFKQRETGFIEQETRIAAELELERGALSDLNRRLDEMEQEIKPPAKPNNQQ